MSFHPAKQFRIAHILENQFAVVRTVCINGIPLSSIPKLYIEAHICIINIQIYRMYIIFVLYAG